MNRTIHYNISKESNGFRIEQFLLFLTEPHSNQTYAEKCPCQWTALLYA